MSKIKDIKAREILDSRGNPTIEVSLESEDGIFIDSVPSGASTGEREALELRDNDENRYFGKGVLNAISNIQNIIFKEIKGRSVTSQKEIDDVLIMLDNTDNKSRLGATNNGSFACTCKSGARAEKKNYLNIFL